MISRWIRARLSHAPWLARALGIHSPSRHMLGTCWCRERPALEQFRLELLLMMVRLDAALTQLELESPPPTTTFLAEGSTVIERPTNPPTSSAADPPTTTEAPPDPRLFVPTMSGAVVDQAPDLVQHCETVASALHWDRSSDADPPR